MFERLYENNEVCVRQDDKNPSDLPSLTERA